MTTTAAQSLETVSAIAQEALANQIRPQRLSIAEETFLLFDLTAKPLAIFKPDAPLETLCFLLDHDRFAGVPPTLYTALSHSSWRGYRQGSLQLYVEGSSQFDPTILNSQDIRRIAQLDIRLTNPDRHLHNFLYSMGQLIPIDHARALPQQNQNCYFEWMGFEGAKTPFTQEEVDYISGLNPEVDEPLFARFRMNSDSFKIYFAATRILKESAARGLTPYEIGTYLEKGYFG